MWRPGDPAHVIKQWSCMRARSAAAALEGHLLVLFKIGSMLYGKENPKPELPTAHHLCDEPWLTLKPLCTYLSLGFRDMFRTGGGGISIIHRS